MLNVLLAIEIILAIALVAVILLQRSEGGALGIGGGGGGMGGLFSARGAANMLTRVTAVLAAAFIAIALLLANLAGKGTGSGSVFDRGGLERPLSEDLPAAGEGAEEGELPALQIPEDDGAASGEGENGGS